MVTPATCASCRQRRQRDQQRQHDADGQEVEQFFQQDRADARAGTRQALALAEKDGAHQLTRAQRQKRAGHVADGQRSEQRAEGHAAIGQEVDLPAQRPASPASRARPTTISTIGSGLRRGERLAELRRARPAAAGR